jgi:phage-related minor tail protein
METIETLQDQLDALESRLSNTAGMTAAFDGALARMGETILLTNREVASLSGSFGSGLKRAFDGVVFDGLRLSDALRQVAAGMSASIYNSAMRPVQNALGGALANGINSVFAGLMPFADGGTFSQGRVMPFAQGGVVTQATSFPMRGGRGLMGEAGPEAIMPLARGPDGRLGVQAGGGGRPVSVVMNITTPDVQGFQRSQSQIAAQAARALARGQRNR